MLFKSKTLALMERIESEVDAITDSITHSDGSLKYPEDSPEFLVAYGKIEGINSILDMEEFEAVCMSAERKGAKELKKFKRKQNKRK
jgi:hypothetical protein